jgi:hypothetical protein
MKRKSQIAIFIVIAAMVIVGFVFLFTTDFETKKEDVEKAVEQVSTTSDKQFLPLKNRINFCLEHQLKKTLFIAGLRGGYVRDYGGDYIEGNYIPADIARSVEVFNISLGYLNRVMYYSVNKIEGYDVPVEKNYADSDFTKTIKKDFEEVIMSGLFDCLSLEKFEEIGYKVIYPDYIGSLDYYDYDNKLVYLNNMDVQLNDVVYFYDFPQFKGKVIENETEIIVQFENGNFPSEDYFTDYLSYTDVEGESIISFVNENYSLYTNVTFEKDSVSAYLNFPLTIRKGNFSTNFQNSVVRVDVPFKSYLDLANGMMYEKNINRSLKYNESSDLGKVLNNNPLSSFISEINKFHFHKLNLNNEDERKDFVYSFVDNNTLIYNLPFVFNFAYTNEAPYLNETKITNIEYDQNEDFYNNDGEIVISLPDSLVYTRNFREEELIFEKQSYDYNNYHFIPNSVAAGGFSASITKEGLLTVSSQSRTSFVFPVVVSDGEAERKYDLRFIFDLISNVDNSDAASCIQVKHTQTQKFPILNEYDNEIFDYVGEDGIHKPFTFFISAGNGGGETPQMEIFFKENCLVDNDPEAYEIKVKKNDEVLTLNDEGKVIFNNPSDFAEISIINFSIDYVNGVPQEDYILYVIPVGCLGPNPITETNQLNFYGGSYSCCDMEIVKDFIENPNFDQNRINNLVSDNSVVLNHEMFFCGTNSSPLDTTNYFNGFPKYDHFNTLFRGKVTSKCIGFYPKPEDNQIEITSQHEPGKDYFQTTIDGTGYNVDLEIVQNGGVCEFCSILIDFDVLSPFRFGGIKFDRDDVSSEIEFYGESTEYILDKYVGPVTIAGSELRNKILCEEPYIWYSGSINPSLLEPSTESYTDMPFSVFKSNKFCNLGTPTCNSFDRETYKLSGNKCSLTNYNSNTKELYSEELNGVIYEISGNNVKVCENGAQNPNVFDRRCVGGEVGEPVNYYNLNYIFESDANQVKTCDGNGQTGITYSRVCVDNDVGSIAQKKVRDHIFSIDGDYAYVCEGNGYSSSAKYDLRCLNNPAVGAIASKKGFGTLCEEVPPEIGPNKYCKSSGADFVCG